MNKQDLLAKLDEWSKTPGEEFDDDRYMPSLKVIEACRSYLNKTAIPWSDIVPNGEFGLELEIDKDFQTGYYAYLEFSQDGHLRYGEFQDCKRFISLEGQLDA